MRLSPREESDETGASSPTRYEGKQQRILDVATALLNERGIRGMTFQEVAQALSLKTTSVIYYFRYKEVLAAAVFADSIARLHAMVRQAAAATTPRERVARYLELYFDHAARALRGEARPLANFSEIRALDEASRAPLIAAYQALFGDVRRFFGDDEEPDRRLELTARAQLLNEALFWSATWLPRYAIGDFASVRERMFNILEHGIAAPGLDRATAARRPRELTVDPGEAGARSAVLRVATRLINQSGYKGASVDRIMAELNLTKGSFYHHVDAKDDLILECFRDSYRRLARIQAQVDEVGGTQWQRLSVGIAAALTLQFEDDYPLLRSTALQAMPSTMRVAAIERGDREALWLAGVLFEGVRDGSVRLVDPVIGGHIVMSTINAAYDIRGWAARQPVGQAVNRYGGLLANGLFC